MVYLDYNATTPLDPRVASSLAEWQVTRWANPSSNHRAGRRDAQLVEAARAQVASAFRRRPRDVIFTSGASEAANLALLGLGLSARGESRRDFLLSATEHKAIAASARLAAELAGGRLRVVRALRSGQVDLEDLSLALTEMEPCAVIVMHTNNETGVINPIDQVRSVVPEDVLLGVDLTQSLGKVDVEDVPFDLGFASGHKVYGPKGIGALIADRHVQQCLTPVFPGGGQERGLRGGTIAGPLVAAFGLAVEIAVDQCDSDAAHSSDLSDQFRHALHAAGVEFIENGAQAPRIPNTLSVHFPGLDSEMILANAPGLELSDGSACTASQPNPSHVLMAMGMSREAASECLRISVGRPTTGDEVSTAVSDLTASIRRVKEMEKGIPA